jgi:F0F1-type ATP synthase membrane subunit b/b'
MTEELKKWFNDLLNKISEKIKKGEELNDKEMEIATSYISNLQLLEHIDKRISGTERSLRDEIRKTREELLANDEKIKQELLKEINTVRGELEKKIEDTRTELKTEIATIKGELEKKIEDTRTELRTEINTVRGELEKKIEDTRTNLIKTIEDVNSKVEATRSDLGLLTEEVYIKNFIDYLDKSGEKVISVYRHYEINVGEIDALIETQTKIYVVEVKMKAEFKDVDSLLVKDKVISEEYKDKNVIPALTGSRISKTVRGYAKGLNVIVV